MHDPNDKQLQDSIAQSILVSSSNHGYKIPLQCDSYYVKSKYIGPHFYVELVEVSCIDNEVRFCILNSWMQDKVCDIVKLIIEEMNK